VEWTTNDRRQRWTETTLIPHSDLLIVLNFLNPWGLLALSSLGGVLFLYFYVFRGRRREVSALFLWDPDRSLRREGSKRRRPPLDLPLILELLAALLLSLVVAGLFYRRVEEHPHVVVILDSSASMNASRGDVDFSDRALGVLRQLAGRQPGDVRISLVESFSGRILGGGVVPMRRAAELVRGWRPGDPPHGFQQAVEVARSLQSESRPVPLITDQRRDGVGFRAIGVGEPLPNTGWTSGRWTGGEEIFARINHFGSMAESTEVIVRDGQGRELSRKEVRFAGRPAVPLTLNVPDEVQSVALELPADALANDNVLRLSRAVRRPLPVTVDMDDVDLEEHLRRALHAGGDVRLVPRGRPALVCSSGQVERRATASEELRLHFHIPSEQAVRTYGGPYFVDGYSPLTRGLDLKGTIWGADPGFVHDDGRPLVSAGEVPLVVMKDRELRVNLSPSRTNLFRHPAWPVLVSNVLSYVRTRMPGLKRFSYRLGESLSFVRPHRWEGRVIVEDPTDRQVSFEEPHIYYGTLQSEGVYRIYPEDSPEDALTVTVNLLAEEESDLTAAESFGDPVRAATTRLSRTRPHTFHRVLTVAAAAALLSCWYLLDRRSY
jgi:hypothetical protein